MVDRYETLSMVHRLSSTVNCQEWGARGNALQVPQFWRGPDNKLYRIQRECRPLGESTGYLYSVRAFAVSNTGAPAAEASVVLREADLLAMLRLNQQVPTPEQLFAEAFQTVMERLAQE
jgi:hypothetical protein